MLISSKSNGRIESKKDESLMNIKLLASKRSSEVDFWVSRIVKGKMSIFVRAIYFSFIFMI